MCVLDIEDSTLGSQLAKIFGLPLVDEKESTSLLDDYSNS